MPSAAGGARVAVRRWLAEQPVLSTEDLTDEQREWWRRNRERERVWVRRWLGLDLALRAAGAIAIEPGGEHTPRPFPSSGSARHFALLLVGELVEELRTVRGDELHGTAWAHVAASTARRAADRVFGTWRRGLRKDHRDNPDVVFEEAVDVLVDAGLVRKDSNGLFVHAAAARYAPRPEILAAGPSGESSLFEEGDA